MPLPWTQIIQWVPPIIELSRDLLVKSKRVPPMPPSTGPEINVAELAGRVEALEENESRQDELL
ncbi:MAG: hypothetical protein KDI32_04945, partial [Pseudomonadales bacterium]|nr:hypothetical protein [Pseudomonadales bacterium]